MGNWNITVQGIGCHHNGKPEIDADLLASEFVKNLIQAGQDIEVATFTSGGRTNILPAPWTRWEAVKSPGEYWWWNEDLDSAPVPVTGSWSEGSGHYFAEVGQLGWNQPQDVKDMGGFWMRISQPSQPKV